MKKKIKILFLIDQLAPGGTEKQLLLLVENLPIDRFNVSIGVFNDTQFQYSLNITTTVINLKSSKIPLIKSVQKFAKLTKYLKNERFDIVQTQFPSAEIYGILATLIMKNKPILIGSRRNIYHWIDNNKISFFLLKKISKINNFVLTNSESASKMCIKLEGIPESKIKLIENGINIDIFNQISTMYAKKKNKLDRYSTVVGVVGNWRPVKGLPVFLRAASILVDKLPKVHFVLSGFGQQKEELIDLSISLNLKNYVTFIENHPNIPELIKSFDIAVQPSFAESFSNVLVEYMAAGKAIVATRVGDAERILSKGKAGIIVEPGNSEELAKAILALVQDNKLAERVGNFAKKKVWKEWRLSIFLNKYISFYENVIGIKE